MSIYTTHKSTTKGILGHLDPLDAPICGLILYECHLKAWHTLVPYCDVLVDIRREHCDGRVYENSVVFALHPDNDLQPRVAVHPHALDDLMWAGVQ